MAIVGGEKRRLQREAFERALAELEPGAALRAEMREARRRAKLSQRQLAARMGTTQPAIARLERGGCSPSLKTLRRLAAETGSRLVLRLEQMGR